MTKAIVIHGYGGPDVLKWEDIEVGDPRRLPFDFSLKKPFDSIEMVLQILDQAIALHDKRKANLE